MHIRVDYCYMFWQYKSDVYDRLSKAIFNVGIVFSMFEISKLRKIFE